MSQFKYLFFNNTSWFDRRDPVYKNIGVSLVNSKKIYSKTTYFVLFSGGNINNFGGIITWKQVIYKFPEWTEYFLNECQIHLANIPVIDIANANRTGRWYGISFGMDRICLIKTYLLLCYFRIIPLMTRVPLQSFYLLIYLSIFIIL